MDSETYEWTEQQTVLLAEDCLSAVPADLNGDGQNKLVVRTRRPKKPYTVYDGEGGDGAISSV